MNKNNITAFIQFFLGVWLLVNGLTVIAGDLYIGIGLILITQGIVNSN